MVWKKRNPFALFVGMQIGAATVESSMEIPQKLETDLPYDPGIPLLGVYLKKSETLIRKNCNVIYSLQDMEAAQVSISR